MNLKYKIIAVSIALFAYTQAFGGVYSDVYSSLAELPHRLPGSDNFNQALSTIEKALKANGIKSTRQSYATQVPENRKLSFTVNGKPVQIFPLGPSNLVNVTTGEMPIEGKIVYLGKGDPKTYTNNIDGNIVLLDWGSPYMRDVFTEGAEAVIFVGNDQADQWDVAKSFSKYNISRPLFYISRKEAEKHNFLTESKKLLNGVLQANVHWKQVSATNLWLKIPAADEKIFKLKRPEAIILTARLDTFGTVPGNVPGRREAANCALLADLTVKLAKQKLERTVFIVFYGSAYNSFDGLRNFYYGVYKSLINTSDPLEERKISYESEHEKVIRLIKVLNTDPVVVKESDDQFEVRMKLRERVIQADNNFNYRLGNINRRLQKLGREKQLNKEKAAEQKLLKTEKKTLEARKMKVTDMRRQLNEGKIAPKQKEGESEKEIAQAKEENQELFNTFKNEVRVQLNKRKDELDFRLLANKDYQKIADAVKSSIHDKNSDDENEMLEYVFISAFNFDFSCDNMPFSFAIRSYEFPFIQQNMELGYYDAIFKAIGETVANLPIQQSEAPLLIEALSSDFTPIALTSRRTAFLAAAASLSLSIPGVNIRNVPGHYDDDEIPNNRQYDLSGLTKTLPKFFSTLANEPKMSLGSNIPETKVKDKHLVYTYTNGQFYGKKFEFLARGGKDVEGPAAGAFMCVGPVLWERYSYTPGFTTMTYAKINQEGYTFLPMVTTNGSWGEGIGSNNYQAVNFGEYGQVNYYKSKDFKRLFYCFGGGYTLNFTPNIYTYSGYPNPLKGKTDGSYSNKYSNARLLPGDGVIYIDRNHDSKLIDKEAGFLVLGSLPADAEGIGVPFDTKSILNLNITKLSAENTTALNKERLAKLHSRNIFNDSIEKLQDKAQKHLEQAGEKREKGKIGDARAHEIFAQTLSARAYTPLKATIDDMVTGVLILLLLCIPFCFAMERLLLGCTSVYRQLMGFGFFFIATFLILYWLHPAFAIAQAPLIIFIAFIIIILSAVVIYIVMTRFKSELMALQGLDTSAHRISSENSTIIAAILIGVSSMRNRPLKTFLTILTVVLLTFTIISFASFNAESGVTKTYLGPGEGETRMEVFQPSHLNIPEPAVNAIKQLYKDKYHVFARSGSFYNPFYETRYVPEHQNMIFSPQTNKFVKLDAVVGFERGEAAQSKRLSRIMPGFATSKKDIPPVYLSNMVIKSLELEVGQLVYIRGMKMRFAGEFNARNLDNFNFLDGSKAIPPDFKATGKAEEKGAGKTRDELNQMESVDSSSFIWGSPNLTALTDVESAVSLSGCMNAVTLYPKGDNADIRQDGEDIADFFNGMVFTKDATGANKLFFTKSISASGIGSIIVPLALGALIIFSSLLGSIADREREIFTFSALGLAPVDVSVLFFAESSVYAVIGGLGGYLFSQFAGMILNILATYGIFQAPEMNYSSLSTVYTILVVMSTVLLSTIYPAIKASRAANPGIARKWKMPKPENGLLKFPFPFTISNIDMGGILMFISEHFENFSDASLGSFTATEVEFFKNEKAKADDPKGYGLRAEITLAPFDLGVSQKFSMTSQPSEIAGVDEIIIDLEKLGGSDPAWLRGNRRFLDEIRNQFLLWRSMPIETLIHYRKMAEGNVAIKKEVGLADE